MAPLRHRITADELALHASQESPWVAIDGEVYDVKRLLNSHPGGKQVLLKSAGGDATEVFRRAGHSAGARQRLFDYCVGQLAPPANDGAHYIAMSPAEKERGDIIPGCCVETVSSDDIPSGYRGRVLRLVNVDGKPGAVVRYGRGGFKVPLASLRRVPFDEECEVTVMKESGQPLGLVLSPCPVVSNVVIGSPADVAGLKMYYQRRLIKVNGVSVKVPSAPNVLDAVDGDKELTLTFGDLAPVPGDYVECMTEDGWVDHAMVTLAHIDGMYDLRLPDGRWLLRQHPDCLRWKKPKTTGPADWHAERRREMLRVHPELEGLQGYQPLSLLVACLVCVVHACTAHYIKEATWLQVLILAYTIGATCKLGQFAMAHEFCHGVVAKWATSPSIRLLCLRLCTLPSIGNTIFEYYAYHHMGHHSLLGKQTISDVVTGFLEGEDLDGDLLHVYPHLFKNRVVVGGPSSYALEKPLRRAPPWLVPFIKATFDTFLHVVHFGLMLFWAGLTGLNALFFPILRTVSLRKRWKKELPSHWVQWELTGRQSWLWLAVFLALALYPSPTLVGFFKILAYMVLSEMFMGGFLFHPFGAYFLGVHRSSEGVHPIPGEETSGPSCQPTHSCYSCWWLQLLSWNLTMHVEHHDFPNIPWSCLPDVRKMAPEFYKDLRELPPPLTVWWKHLTDHSTQTYACNSC